MIVLTEKWEVRKKRLKTWHLWFAWYPVTWDGGWAWLSHVERRAYWSWSDFIWDYRVPIKKEGA